MKKSAAVLILVLLLLAGACSACALELKTQGIRSFDDNILTVNTETGGTLTIEAVSGTVPLKNPVTGLEIPAGKTEILWDGLTFGGEPLQQGKLTLRAILEHSDGTREETSVTTAAARPRSAAVCCLPAAESVYLDGKTPLRIEVGVSGTGTCELSIASKENPEEELWHMKDANGQKYPVVFWWDGRNRDHGICEPGVYILSAYTSVCRERVIQAEVTLLAEPVPEPELAVTGSLIPTDLSDDAAVWEALTAPVAVGAGEEGNGLYIVSEKSASSPKAGTCSCRTVGVAVLEICGDGWVKVGAWRQPDGAYIEGYVKEDKLRMIRPNTRYGILLDKKEQMMTVYEYGKPIGTVLVSTGLVDEKHPKADTHSGVYLLGTRMAGFERDGHNYQYPIRIDGSNLIHQLGYAVHNGERSFEEEMALLGSKASHGCIRVDPRITEAGNGINSWWIWTHLPHDTKIIITPDE